MVPHNHPESNHRAMTDFVYSSPAWRKGGSAQVVNTALPVELAAAEYEERLIKAFAVTPGAVPHMDVVLLGMGEDGHIASLFPGAPELAYDITRDPVAVKAAARRMLDVTGRSLDGFRVRCVVPVSNAPKAPKERVSLTLSVINNAVDVRQHAAEAGPSGVLDGGRGGASQYKIHVLHTS